MPPSEKKLIAELKTEIKNVYDDPEERPLLTVRYIRDKVTNRLGLADGFFVQGTWKDKSKKLIQSYAQELIDEEDAPIIKPEEEKKKPTPKAKPLKESTVKKGTKRESGATKGRPVKRQKKEETPSEDEDMLLDGDDDVSLELTESSDFGDTEDSDAPKKKSKAKAKAKTPVKRQRKSNAKAESEGEDAEDSDAPKPKKKAKAKAESKPPVNRQTKSKAKIENSEDESSLSDVPTPKDEDSDESPKKNPVTKKGKVSKVESEDEDTKMTKDEDSDAAPPSAKKPTPKKASVKKEAPKASFKSPPSDDKKANVKPTANDGRSDSEMSVLKDEDDAPKPKKKRQSKSDSKSEPKSKAAKAAKAGAAPKDLSPDELTMKTLQSQLKKCGISKIWQFELKQYGDDTARKIQHLQEALRDVGMKGRFSEARAREIKEMRELQADLEAVKEGEKSWGLERGRASRSAAKGGAKKKKSLREESGSGSEAEGSGDEKKTRSPSASEQPSRVDRNRARAGLAFLSDSDE